MALQRKTLGGITFLIDRPEGYTKVWPTKSFTYPCDYGYFPRLKGEDDEGLDAFVGDDPEGHLESFQKLKPDAHGRMVLDETKFLLGVTDQERETIYKLYGDEVHARKTYRNWDEVKADLERFKTKKHSPAKTAAERAVRDVAQVYALPVRIVRSLAGSQT